MTYFTEEVRHKFEIMYECDQARDASDNIRGFLFQDLVVIEFLLEDQVQYVASEFLEDVDVAYNDGNFKVIQVKYYPKTRPNMKEIATDLYYQYLRFDLLNNNSYAKNKIKLKPQLLLYRDKTVLKPDLDKMKNYIGTVLPEKPTDLTDIELKLKSDISTQKKELQKERVFLNWSYEQSVIDFLNDFEIIKKNNIEQLQSEIENKLEKLFASYAVPGLREQHGKILIGLAIIFIQKRYRMQPSGVEDILIRRKDFIDYIQNHITFYNDKSIVAYISTLATEEYEMIISENDGLSNDQSLILNIIYRNTIEWIVEYCNNLEGQFCIVNTLSTDTRERVLEFLNYDISERLLSIAGCKENLKSFFRYLWKIIFDISSESKDVELKKNDHLLKPQNYMVKTERKYICFRFPYDYVKTSVILPPAYPGTFNSRKTNYCLRMMEEKPRKWFMACDSKFSGKHDYDYSTAKIVSHDSVIDLEKDCFIIECMQCIKIDENEWSEIDDCRNCIFAEKCVERGN